MADAEVPSTSEVDMLVQQFDDLRLDDLDLNDNIAYEDLLLQSDSDLDESDLEWLANEGLSAAKKSKRDEASGFPSFGTFETTGDDNMKGSSSTPVVYFEDGNAKDLASISSTDDIDLSKVRKFNDDDDQDCFYSPQDTNTSVEDILEGLENTYIEQRSRVIGKNGFVSTPLHALKDLAAKNNEPIHNEVVIIPHKASGKSTVRVEIICGVYRGVGEAFKSRQATQMAALDILMQVEQAGGFHKIIPYAIFPGWRIKARIVRDLTEICRRNRLKTPKLNIKSNIDQPEVPLYTAEVSIGGKVISEGSSDICFTAKKLAAYNAIEYITGIKCPKEYVALGEVCTSHEELLKRGYKPKITEGFDSMLEKKRQQKEAELADTAYDSLENAKANFNISDVSALQKIQVTVHHCPKKNFLRRQIQYA